MKKTWNSVLMLTLVMMLWLTSCTKDQTIEIDLKIPNASFIFDFSSMEVSNGDVLKITASVDTDKSSKGLEIKRVQYFWDDQHVETKTVAPYVLNYKIEGQTTGKHTLTVKVRYGGAGYTEMETNEGFKYEINVVEKKDNNTSMLFGFGCTYLSKYLANGENFIMQKVRLSSESTTAGWEIDYVKYFFDDNEISTAYSDPYGMTFLIQNQAVGKHELKYEVHANNNSTSSIETGIVDIYVLAAPLNIDLDVRYETKDFFHEGILNGEILSGTVSLVEDASPADAQIKEASFYWDDVLFATTKTAPFKFSYNVTNQTVGAHFFTINYVVTSSVGEIEYTSVIGINVIK